MTDLEIAVRRFLDLIERRGLKRHLHPDELALLQDVEVASGRTARRPSVPEGS